MVSYEHKSVADLSIHEKKGLAMSQAVGNREYVYSRLASDPDLRDIVDMFVEEMPGRVAWVSGAYPCSVLRDF